MMYGINVMHAPIDNPPCLALSRHNLLICQINRYKKTFILSGLLKLANTLVQFLPSLVVARLLKFVSLISLDSKVDKMALPASIL